MRYKHWLGLGAGLVLGLIFLVAGTGKALAQAELFESPFLNYLDFLNLEQVRLLFHGLPYVEIVIGLFLVTGFAMKLVAAFSSLLIAAFITSNTWFITHGMGFEPCSCLGIFSRLLQNQLSTQQSLYLDITMLALVLVTLFCYQRRFTDIYPWFMSKE